jgi:chromosome segregation ATPase
MKRTVVITCLVLGMSLGLGAQESGLPYVDIDAANAEISDLQANSQERSTQNQALEADTQERLSEIQRDQQEMVEIDPILARVNAELTELFEVNRTIVDEGMKDRSQEAIGRARSIKANLQAQLRRLEGRIEGNRTEIEENRERVRINDRRIAQNGERVLFLEAAIRQTEAQQERLDSFITSVDAILGEAEQYVEQEPAATNE